MSSGPKYKILSFVTVLGYVIGSALARPDLRLPEQRRAVTTTTTSSCPVRCIDLPNTCGGTWQTCIPSCSGQSIPTFTQPPCSTSTACQTVCFDAATNSCGGLWGTCLPQCPGQPFPRPTEPPCTPFSTTTTAATTSSCPTLCIDFITNSCGGLWGTCLEHCAGQPFPTPTPPPCTSTPPTRTTSSRTTTSQADCSAVTQGESPYYLDQLKHQGLYHLNTSYPVYRNVKCWGAKGDGVTDDTDAIIRALTEGKTCKGSNCQNFYVPPSLVYFPKGEYIVGKTLPIYRNTQVIGARSQRPVIRANNYTFVGSAIFETKVKESIGGGAGDFITLKKFALIGGAVPRERDFAAIRWSAGHASGIYQVQITMSYDTINNHRGIVVSDTPHIWMSDVSTSQGDIGIDLSVQAGTLRNIAILYSQSIGIRITSDYSLTLKNLYIYRTPIGIDASKVNLGSPNSQAVNSLVILEGEITVAKVFIRTARGGSSTYPNGAGSIVLERFTVAAGVPVVQRDNGVNVYHPSPVNTYRYINLWAQGRRYTPPSYEVATMQNPITNPKFSQPVLRTENEEGIYYEKDMPSSAYQFYTAADFISVRSYGVKGDGVSDDSARLQQIFHLAASTGRPVFVDYGIYIVTRTLIIRPGTRIIGEVWPKFMAAGHYFANPKNPHPVFQIGNPGETGRVEIQDILVTAKAGSAGAISFQWNLKGPAIYNDVGGMWSCHSVIGAQPFSGLEAAQCAHNPTPGAKIRSQCIGGFMHLHITRYASNVYLENNYYASAAYQSIQPSPSKPLDIYVGRGVLIDGSPGAIWLYSIASENSIMYQYQIQNSADIFVSTLQSTNPSFQSNPAAPAPFSVNTTLSDPNFSTICKAHTGAAYAKCAKAFGLRVINSDNLVIYSAALLSGKDNYATSCPGGHFNCQLVIVSVEKQARSPVNKLVNMYGLTVRGARYALLMDGKIIIDSQKNAGTSLALPVIAWFLVGGVLPS